MYPMKGNNMITGQVIKNDVNKSHEEEFEFEAVSIDEHGVVTHRQKHHALQYVENLANNVTLEMVRIPEGRFNMGSRSNQGFVDEQPQHNVGISSFYMGKYPVTQEQWKAVMDWTPPFRCEGAKRPVDRVSWVDAQKFCDQISRLSQHKYRLPSEAEWEYACRAGTSTPFYCGDTITTEHANYVGDHTFRFEPKGVYRHIATEVGTFPANAYGLFDMHGNVWEWCADVWYDDYSGAPIDGSSRENKSVSYRVLRGGCWHDPPNLCRSAARLKQPYNEQEDFLSFRVALTSLDPGLTTNTKIHKPTFSNFFERIRIHK